MLLEKELKKYVNDYINTLEKVDGERAAAYSKFDQSLSAATLDFKVKDEIASNASLIGTASFTDGFIQGYKYALVMMGITDKNNIL